jgi:hypothetical protein
MTGFTARLDEFGVVLANTLRRVPLVWCKPSEEGLEFGCSQKSFPEGSGCILWDVHLIKLEHTRLKVKLWHSHRAPQKT